MKHVFEFLVFLKAKLNEITICTSLVISGL